MVIKTQFMKNTKIFSWKCAFCSSRMFGFCAAAECLTPVRVRTQEVAAEGEVAKKREYCGCRSPDSDMLVEGNVSCAQKS